MAGTNIESALTSTLKVRETDSDGLILSATCTGAPPTTASIFQHGAICVRTDSGTGTKAIYENTGSTASPAWNLIGDVTAGEIALAEGSILVGNNAGVATALSAKTTTAILIGNGTTITSAAMTGDVSMTNAGVVTVTKSTGVFAAGGKVTFYKIGSAEESASGLLMGVGTSANPAASSTASAIFAEFRTKNTATSGDSRGLYWRHEINGAGAGGECVRAFTKVTAATTTVRGSHISIDLDAAGTCSGYGAAVDAQVMLGGAAYAGNYSAVNCELYGNASATVTGRTSMIRAVINGDGTAVANINANAFFLDLTDVTAGTSGFIDTDVTALTGYGSMKVRCPDGVTRFIPITTGS